MSRIIVKNLPKSASNSALRSYFKNTGNITDIKLLVRDGTFRGCAFIGFENSDQANSACTQFNSAFFAANKIAVELAKDFNDKSRPKAVRVVKEEQQDKYKKREEAIQFRIQLSKLRGAGDDKKKRSNLLINYINDPKFKQYVELSGGAGKVGLTEAEWTKIEGDKEISDKTKELESKEDEGIETEDNLARKEDISDKDYWKSLMTTEDDKKDKESPKKGLKKGQTPKKKKEWKEFFTVRLRIENIPKSVITKKSVNNKIIKKRGLDKNVVKDFFKPLKCCSVRRNSNNKFEYFIGFSSEKYLKQACLQDRSFLDGVRVKVTNISPVSDTTKIVHGQGTAPWAESEAKLEKSETIAESGKIYVRNLSYLTSEEKLKERFESFGTIVDLELPICKLTRKIKGFATITYQDPRDAVTAMNALDGADLLGRVMHVLPCLSDNQLEQEKSWMVSAFKKEKEKKRSDMASSWHNWNTLFIPPSSVADLLAKKYHKTKEEIMNMEGTSVGVTLALAETEIVDQTKNFLIEHGVSVDAFIDPKIERSDTVLLVKNLPANTKASDMAELFGKWGDLGRVVMPPSGTTCIVEFTSGTEARDALKNNSYKRFGPNPLYIEKAPVKTFKEEYKKPKIKSEKAENDKNDDRGEKRKRDENDLQEKIEQNEEKKVKSDEDEKETNSSQDERTPEDHTTVYIENLPREISQEDIDTHFSKAGEVYAVVVAKKGNQSRGYGFVQYYLQKDARNALIKLENSTLGGRNISLKLSEKKLNAVSKTSRKMHEFGVQKGSKIVVKNIPFQATKKEIEELFKAFGPMKRVHLQKHHAGQYNNGGYGFVEYIKTSDAKRALDMMGLSTHFQGRRLVLEWAKEDDTLEEIREKTAKKRNIVESFNTVHKKMRDTVRDMDNNSGNYQNDD